MTSRPQYKAGHTSALHYQSESYQQHACTIWTCGGHAVGHRYSFGDPVPVACSSLPARRSMKFFMEWSFIVCRALLRALRGLNTNSDTAEAITIAMSMEWTTNSL